MKHIYLFLLVLFSTAAFAGSGPFHFTKANRPQHKLRLTKRLNGQNHRAQLKYLKPKCLEKRLNMCVTIKHT